MAERIIFLVDMQSFYASVEKADRPELKDRPVIVSGDPERRSGVVLAACPLAKKFGVQNAWRLWEAQQKCPQAVIVRPRMQRYLEVSYKITTILERFTDLVEVYSVDEQFMDLTPCRKRFTDAWTVAREVQKAIMEDTGVPARVGIGPNKVLAKIACDNFAKKNHPDGRAELNAGNMKQKMWPLPVGAMFGVGSRMERHLRRMGVRTIGHLAQFPLSVLKKRWGINGELLWLIANGIDPSPVRPKTHETQKAVGHHMTLPRDYETAKEIRVVLLELCEEVARRVRAKRCVGRTISVGVRGADFDRPTGFHRQAKLPGPTQFGSDLYAAACRLFERHWDRQPIRSVGVALSQLEPALPHQESFFDDFARKQRLSEAMDALCAKYGPTAVMRAVSVTEAGQARERAQKIGGHYK
ncbi:MAG TPA: DNA polymerase IV [Bacillales bacterium]|nr:DNA polymerase IV [Bacillales bacterium]